MTPHIAERVNRNIIASLGHIYQGSMPASTSTEQSLTKASPSSLADYYLLPAFPNPFNPTTTIRFTIPNRGQVRLIVVDELGRNVAELVNGDVEAGYHEVKFDGSRLASGVYFYRLQAGSFVETKKLLLVR